MRDFEKRVKGYGNDARFVVWLRGIGFKKGEKGLKKAKEGNMAKGQLKAKKRRLIS